MKRIIAIAIAALAMSLTSWAGIVCKNFSQPVSFQYSDSRVLGVNR
jgi:hypothetical protein